VTKVGVIDVGSNTARLLVASVSGRSVTAVAERKAWLRLGADIGLLGSISTSRLSAAEAVVSEFAVEARRHGSHTLQVLVTSPGRQARNSDELVRRLSAGSGSVVRVLTAEEEADLAFIGATSSAPSRGEVTAVVDVGGGSTQLAVGSPKVGPQWEQSFDLGSLLLASRAFDADPPGKKGLRKACVLLLEQLDSCDVPAAKRALAVGGSARALRRLVGSPKLSAGQLRSATQLLRKCSSGELTETYGFAPDRARTLAAGAVILSEIQKRLDVPLLVARGGVREGAALLLAAERNAA
jgi:exopolyphosphatase / guanosine-5'-triphosphate,3'-diphosphate pyrophosphatase